jgi:hypothetical protein
MKSGAAEAAGITQWDINKAIGRVAPKVRRPENVKARAAGIGGAEQRTSRSGDVGAALSDMPVTKQAATERLSVGNTESLRRFLSNCRNS